MNPIVFLTVEGGFVQLSHIVFISPIMGGLGGDNPKPIGSHIKTTTGELKKCKETPEEIFEKFRSIYNK